jgi:hypothetical protein
MLFDGTTDFADLTRDTMPRHPFNNYSKDSRFATACGRCRSARPVSIRAADQHESVATSTARTSTQFSVGTIVVSGRVCPANHEDEAFAWITSDTACLAEAH